MTGIETKNALVKIATDKADEYANKLKTLDKTSQNERKALSIARQVALNCASYPKVESKDRMYTLSVRLFGKEFHDFDEYKPMFEKLEGDARDSFLEFSFCIIMSRHAYYNTHVETLKTENLPAEQRFAHEVVIATVDDILREWQRWWNENGSCKCEVIKL